MILIITTFNINNKHKIQLIRDTITLLSTNKYIVVRNTINNNSSTAVLVNINLASNIINKIYFYLMQKT